MSQQYSIGPGGSVPPRQTEWPPPQQAAARGRHRPSRSGAVLRDAEQRSSTGAPLMVPPLSAGVITAGGAARF